MLIQEFSVVVVRPSRTNTVEVWVTWDTGCHKALVFTVDEYEPELIPDLTYIHEAQK